MTTAARLRQARMIAAMQLRRVFFSRRSLWVYLLAFFPSVIFFFHGLEVQITRQRYAADVTSPALIQSVREGDSDDDVLTRLGEPISDRTYAARQLRNGNKLPERRDLTYFDGSSLWYMRFEAGLLTRNSEREIVDFAEERLIFAAVFTYYYVRLAIFFGCLGIFMNLFRGEMLDKTLHYWFLAPTRRDVLLLGKYLAGLTAATTIFTTGAAICYLMMLWPQESAELAAFWPDPGLSHLLWYCAAAVLGCVGYGSVFLAAGLLLRNPIVPAAALLFWESINSFLPAMLQKFSVLYYVNGLTPVPLPMDDGAPIFVQLLMRPAAPPSALASIAGLLALTLLVLFAASRAVRTIEIDYGTD